MFCWESVQFDPRLQGLRYFVAGSLFSLILACVGTVTLLLGVCSV